MCKGRLKKWKIHKYNTEERVRDFLGQLRDGSARRSQARSRKVDKYLRRKKVTADALLVSHQKTLDEQKQAQADDSAGPELDDMIAETEETPGLAPIVDDSFRSEQYEEDCPYQGNEKWFRLKEDLSDGAQYQGDSFGDQSRINQYSDKRCTSQCLCRRQDVASAAVFLVEKTHKSMCITFNSTPLLSLVQTTLRELGVNLGISPSVDGLLLLQHQGALQGRLSEWRVNRQGLGYNTLLREFELLVDGVLCNGEIFKSFGYEQLKERGIIDNAILGAFSRQNLEASVEGLEEAFEDYCADQHCVDRPLSASQPWPAMRIPCEGENPTFGSGNLDWKKIAQALITQALITQALNNLIRPTSETNQDISCGDSGLFPHEPYKPYAPYEIDLLSYFRGLADLQWRLITKWTGEGKPIFDSEIVEDLLDEPLTIAAVERDAVTMRRHLKRGSSPDTLLLYAATTNDTATLRFLLEQGADAGEALVTASSFGFQSVVEVFLAHGVDVNCITRCGSPLSVAAKSGHRPLAIYLVQCGADANTAIKCLHLGLHLEMHLGLRTDDHSDAEDMLRKLPKAVWMTKRTFAQRTANLSEGMLYLRNRLAVHHKTMKQKASLSTSAFREVGHELSGYRSLWSLGIKTLRLLINGRAPRSLAEAVAFLCIARAMVDVFEARHHRDFLQEFIKTSQGGR
ncbi:hypothetical protein LZ31DRAFT_203225 [Colletotrichum somersetense]|nr:hypothetical protein LZ31DRAFT_203225 [Colletotrichum somersetense]